MYCSTPGSSVHYLPKCAQIHVHRVSDTIEPFLPLHSRLLLPSIFPASGLFQCVSCSHQVAKVLELQLQHQSFQWIFRLISFRIDWVFFAVQGTRKSLLQHHNSKTSILQCSAFFMVQLSHPYMTTGKIIALTTRTFVGKVMSLLLNTLSSVCDSFSSKEQASFNFMAAVTICSDFETQENKICHCFLFFPFYFLWSNGTGCHDLSYFHAEF